MVVLYISLLAAFFYGIQCFLPAFPFCEVQYGWLFINGILSKNGFVNARDFFFFVSRYVILFILFNLAWKILPFLNPSVLRIFCYLALKVS